MTLAFVQGLWFALCLPLIVLMYLFRRKYVDTDVSSHLLWSRALQNTDVRRPWQRLRSHLLLVMQLLIALFLVLALAQPLVFLSEPKRAHIVIVLDRSASMQAQTGDMTSTAADAARSRDLTRLAAAKQQLAAWLEENRAAQYTLVVNGSQPQIIVETTSEAPDVIDALQHVTPYYGESAYAETVSFALALADNDPEAGVIWFTDGNWTEVPHIDYDADKIEFIESNATFVRNVSVSGFGVARDDEGTVRGVAQVRNWSSVDEDELVVMVRVDEEDVIARTIHLAPYELQSVFFDPLPHGDLYRVRLDTDDALVADNTAYAFLQNRGSDEHGSVSALLLGETSVFMRTALSVSGVQTIQAETGSDGSYVIPRSPFDLIVIEQPQPERYDTPAWRELLEEKPVWMAGVSEAALTPVQGALLHFEHPLTGHLRLDDTYFAQANPDVALPWHGMEPVVQIGDTILVYAGTSSLGVAKILHTFNLSDTDFALRADFPVYVGNAVEWLLRGRAGDLGAIVAHGTLEVERASSAHAAYWRLLEPAAPGLAMTEWEANPETWQTAPPVPGLYAFEERTNSGETVRSRRLFVYPDPAESELERAPIWQRWPEESDPAAGRKAGGEVADATPQASRTTFPVYPWLALWVLLLLCVEWEVFQRGRSV